LLEGAESQGPDRGILEIWTGAEHLLGAAQSEAPAFGGEDPQQPEIRRTSADRDQPSGKSGIAVYIKWAVAPLDGTRRLEPREVLASELGEGNRGPAEIAIEEEGMQLTGAGIFP